MAPKDDSLPTGRIRRAAKLGTMVGTQAARGAAVRATTVGRGDKRQIALEEWQIQAAEQAVETLGSMKGLAMKAGQVASFLDTGLLEPEANARIQVKLAELRDSAPRVAFKDMRKVIETELEEPLAESFAEFDEDAVAAASIGQVYRARLHDGRDVAVKVQYPGVAQAVRSDLQNLGLLMRVAKKIAPGMDSKAMTREIRERITDELDYEQEAQAQRAFARAWRGHPFVVIPEVVTSLTRERVLVSEWADGLGFEEVRALPQADRNRFGEIVFRFFFGSLYRIGHFSGDPHPGNFKLMDDGKVVFLDFGMTKQLSRVYVEDEIAALRLGMEGDAQKLFAHLADMGFFDPEDPVLTPESVHAHFCSLTHWYLDDRDVTADRDLVAQVLIDFGDPRSRHWETIKRETLPPDAMLARRMEALTLGVLGQLDATANWHRIAREWMLGDPPATPLGEQEAPHFAGGAAA